MNHKLIHGDCREILRNSNEHFTCIFADPPDNIGLKYGDFKDKREDGAYIYWLRQCIELFIQKADVVWISYNAKWWDAMGTIALDLQCEYSQLEIKPCVQIFTFGQHNQHDLGSGYRPLLRFKYRITPLYPDAIRVPSQRQLCGDKRADPRGRVPSDVFDFPRVTGNSKQRRQWCPTQLHEGLIERCIKLSTLEGQRVLDPFAGSGSTLRACKRINRPVTLIECNEVYCQHIAREHDLKIEKKHALISPAFRKTNKSMKCRRPLEGQLSLF